MAQSLSLCGTWSWCSPSLDQVAILLAFGKTFMSIFRYSTLPSNPISPSCRPKEATFGSSGVTQLTLPANRPISYYNFAQELIEDLCVHHLDQLPSQPAQLEASLLHPSGVVIHVDALLQSLKLCFCSTVHYIRIPKPSRVLLPNVLYPGNRTGA